MQNVFLVSFNWPVKPSGAYNFNHFSHNILTALGPMYTYINWLYFCHDAYKFFGRNLPHRLSVK